MVSAALLSVLPAIYAAPSQPEAPVVELQLMHAKHSALDAQLEDIQQRREKLEAEYVAKMESVYSEELAKATPLLQQTVKDITSKYQQYIKKSSRAFIEDPSRPDNMLITLADSKPIAKDIEELVVANEKELNAQEKALLQSSLAEIRSSVDSVVGGLTNQMLTQHKSKMFIAQNEQGTPFDVQIEAPKASFMKVSDGVAKLSLLRAQGIQKMHARVQSVLQQLFKHTRKSVFAQVHQPHVSASPAGGDVSGLLNEVLQGANSIVSVGSARAGATASKETLDKASDDLKSVTNGALAMQSASNRAFVGKQFLALMPVPAGDEVKNRLFDTEPMQRPAVASLNIFVEEDNRANNFQAKFNALKSQVENIGSRLAKALQG